MIFISITYFINSLGLDAVHILSERVVREQNIARFLSDENAWPPSQPKSFTPLLLIHNQGQHMLNHSLLHSMAKSIQKLIVEEFSFKERHPQLEMYKALGSDTSRTTKELPDIVVQLEDNVDLPQFVLVEGLPGIGKSSLLQEIAYRWSKKQLLQKFELLLLVHLRNPAVQNISYFSELLQLFCKGDVESKEISSACSKYFFKSGGKSLILLFDGFDEFPKVLQRDGLIASIIKRQVLPNCGLVVSSRPHASVALRQKASIKVNILGFTENERKQYIEQALKGQPHKITELTNYLNKHTTINGLCFVPSNMVILVYLYEQGIPLPKSPVDLYQYFICLTVCRYLRKGEYHLDDTITELANLPEPCKVIIEQLSRLALEALNDNKLVFTFDEVKAACPGITAFPDGFGLLQTVQYFGLAGETMRINFIHFSIQEFLAAYHLAHLPQHEEFRILQEKFWSSRHYNMFSMYTTLTKGQQPSFKRFLQQPSMLQMFMQYFQRSLLQRFMQYFSIKKEDNIDISKNFLNDDLKRVHLFRCIHEAGDMAICQSILAYDSNDLCLSNHTLTMYDVSCLTLFLSCSPKKWSKVDLSFCHMQDHGLLVLHRELIASDCTIETLWLGFNGLTQSSSFSIKDLVIHCGVEHLWVAGNCIIGKDCILFNVLSHPSSRLTSLSIFRTGLSSSAAISLFSELAKGNRLEKLFINIDNATDETYDAITASMKKNTSLICMMMNIDDVSAEDAQQIVKALRFNNTLQKLYLNYQYPKDVKKKIILLQDEVNKERESRRCKREFCVEFDAQASVYS